MNQMKMKLKLIKKETILSLALIVAFLVLVGLNTNVLASNEVPQFSLNLTTTNSTNNAGNGNSIEIINTATQNNTNTLNTVNNTTNTPGQLANTGLEDLPYLLITLLVVTAIFAYKKIEEYKSF